MNPNTDRDWLEKKAEQEDGCEVGVGGTFIVNPETVATSQLMFTAPNADPIVTFHNDGRVEVNPKYSAEEAAQVFWTEVKRIAHPEDDPEMDATDFAHPAWWRGQEYSHKIFCYHANKILDGEEIAGTCGEPWQSLRLRLARLRDKAMEIEEAPEPPGSIKTLMDTLRRGTTEDETT